MSKVLIDREAVERGIELLGAVLYPCDSEALQIANAFRAALEQAGVEPDNVAVHLAHCNQGEWEGVCKYGDDDCPALTAPQPAQQPVQEPVAWIIEFACGRDVYLERPDFGRAQWKEPPIIVPLYTAPQPVQQPAPHYEPTDEGIGND